MDKEISNKNIIEENNNNEASKNDMFNEILDWVESCVFFILVFFCLFIFVFLSVFF